MSDLLRPFKGFNAEESQVEMAVAKHKRIRSKGEVKRVSNTEWAVGVHGYHWCGRPGESTAGMQLRTGAQMMTTVKDKHRRMLDEIRALRKTMEGDR